MKYVEIENQLSEHRKLMRKLNEKVRETNLKLTELNKLKMLKEAEMLVEFLGLSSTIELNKWVTFSGVQINIKNTPSMIQFSKAKEPSNIWTPNFKKGDVIKIIKLNNKSVVIECVNKILSTQVDGKSVEKSVNPQSQFRIESESFKNGILSDSDYYKAFTTWIKRKESLEQLLG